MEADDASASMVSLGPKTSERQFPVLGWSCKIVPLNIRFGHLVTGEIRPRSKDLAKRAVGHSRN